MTLYASPWTEDEETVNLLCVLNGIRSNKVIVKWEAITGTTSENVRSHHEIMVSKNGDEKGTKLISQVTLEMKKWSSGISYKCQATDKSLSNSRNISFCSAYPSSSSSMYLEKLTLERENQTHMAADCTAVGPYGTTLSLLVDGALKSTTEVPAGSGPKKITCNLSYRTEKWRESEKITCKAKHQCYNPLEKTINIPRSTVPTVKLFLVPKEPDAGDMTLLCLGTGVNPQIKWLKGSVVKESSVTTMHNDGQLTVSSEMNVQKDEWNKGEIFTCQVEDQLARVAVQQNISKCTESPPSSQTATMFIVGPSLTEKLGSGDLQVTCHVQACGAEAFSITWKMNGNIYSRQTTKQDNGNGTQTLTSALIVKRQNWEKKPNISCHVKHTCSSSIRELQLEQTKDPKQPTLQIIRPSKGTLDKQRITTLLCLILDFFPADIDVYWELDGLKLSESQYSNSAVFGVAGRGDDGGYSMHSKLHIPQSDRNDGHYSCVVKHESSKEPIKHTISNKNDLNTLEAINEEDENINNISNDTAQEDNLTEIWNTALTFIILFLVSVVYSICVTFVKVK
nr:TCR gamma alternate reading frame protein [Paramormyrops kingsleyae]